MRALLRHLQFLAAVQLLPALESGEETLVGGQAVLEGVMMRSQVSASWCMRTGLSPRGIAGADVTS